MKPTLTAMQFPHPGDEHRPGKDASGFMGWNVGDHCRKFLETNGTWVSNSDSGSGPLRFWGEWEAPSTWLRLERPTDKRLPRFLHKPAAPGRPEGRRQNTDPLVMGGFVYSNCRQHRLKDEPSLTKMTNLDVGSVILFGSKFRREWVLDTVFVVAERQEFGPADVEELAAESPLLGDAVLRPLYSRPGERRDFVLYRGATADAPVDGRYSFVPAIPAERGSFARPKIDHPAMNVNLTQETRVLATGSDVADVWELARRQTLEIDLVLATSLDGPGTVAAQAPPSMSTTGRDRGRC